MRSLLLTLALVSATFAFSQTNGEEYWMWGHHPDSFDVAASLGENYNFPKGRRIDMADACRSLGVDRCCVVRWRGLPAYPYDDYARQFTNLAEIAWSIVDSDKETFEWKQSEALRLARLHSNLTTFFLDDFFNGDWKKLPPDLLLAFKARARTVNPASRLACVLYADTNGIKSEFKPSLDVCDVVSLWFWNGKSLSTMRSKVEDLRRLIGPDKKVLLGIYLWDFGGKKPLTRAETESQLATAEWLLDRKFVNGLIFHCTPLVDLRLDSVDSARRWLQNRQRARSLLSAANGSCAGCPGGKMKAYFNEAIVAYAPSEGKSAPATVITRYSREDPFGIDRQEDFPQGAVVASLPIVYGIPGLRNVRDIGGWTGLRTGRVFRGSQFMRTAGAPDGIDYKTRTALLDELKLARDLDLRGVKEWGIRDFGHTNLVELQELGIVKLSRPFPSYLGLFTHTNIVAKALRDFTESANYPIYIHCAGGADRTGSLILLLEALCGVPEYKIDIDYELTSFAKIYGLRHRDETERLKWKSFKDALRERYPADDLNGSVLRFVTEGVGLKSSEIARIRAQLLPAAR